ncbi:MAG: sterol desaturase family protein [Myxococcota bacterium]|nr:sterol desaturase family protein [Myxococcota bacterium]
MRTALRFALLLASFVTLTIAERRRPLRRPTNPANRRLVINLVVGAVGFGALALLYNGVVVRTVRWSAEREVGLLRWLEIPEWVASPLAVVLLDYTLWHWHWLNHRVPLLWRFHAAHHADLDLDASTALRFHPGELVLSLPFRAAQVALLGVALGPLLVWETLVALFVQFHHSNLRLPTRFERVLGGLIITPRIHGIHHSRRPRELHSNFGTLLSLWDRLHGLRVVDVPQDSIAIGLPHQRDRRALGARASLRLPFARRIPSK